MSDIKSLEAVIDYIFGDENFIGQALTHTSASKASGGVTATLERLEFLGDRVLGLVVADMLLRAFPDEREGAVAKRHAALVCRESLAAVAEEINLGKYIVMSDAERKSGGEHNETILADCTEAVIGALYRDGGLTAAESFIRRYWEKRIHSDEAPPIDYKSALQELVQGTGKHAPVYEFAGRTGPDHKPVFTVICRADGFEPVEASGESKKSAEKKAAEKMLAVINGKKENTK